MQTKEGHIKALKTIRENQGDDFWERIGSLGGKKKVPTKGFGSDRERAAACGRLGGAKSSRKGIPNKKTVEKSKQ